MLSLVEFHDVCPVYDGVRCRWARSGAAMAAMHRVPGCMYSTQEARQKVTQQTCTHMHLVNPGTSRAARRLASSREPRVVFCGGPRVHGCLKLYFALSRLATSLTASLTLHSHVMYLRHGNQHPKQLKMTSQARPCLLLTDSIWNEPATTSNKQHQVSVCIRALPCLLHSKALDQHADCIPPMDRYLTRPSSRHNEQG